MFHKVRVVQGISSSEWCLRTQVRSHPVLTFSFCQVVYRGKIPEMLKKLPEQGMYLSRSLTGNTFPSGTVVVWRHHVYVREFHHPSCNSVRALKKGLTAILQILVGTLPLSADPGKVLFINMILNQSFRHQRRQRCATSRYWNDFNREPPAIMFFAALGPWFNQVTCRVV